MTIRIDKKSAKALVRRAADESDRTPIDAAWTAKIEKLSELCAQGTAKTHLAFLATAILAKSIDRRFDLFAIKPKLSDGNENAFSARGLCHSVLVPLSAELGISLGVTGREPLNNQPYFRMTRLDDGTPIHAGGRAAFDYMLSVVKELQVLPTESDAIAALRAFIAVRRQYQPRYTDHVGEGSVSPEGLVNAIRIFVQSDSEHGRRAQAVVAGLMDVFAGPERVESGRINDPSRNYPGDVCVRSSHAAGLWEKALEVRDKPVAESDVQIFGKKCLDLGVREAAVVMASERQQPLDDEALASWAAGFGLGLTLFYGWEKFVDQALFWSDKAKPIAADFAAQFIHHRLVAVEASPDAVTEWGRLTRMKTFG